MTDAELARAARDGSDAAFARIVARHQGAVRSFLRRMCAGGWEDADDLAQALAFTKPTFNEDMRAGHTNM